MHRLLHKASHIISTEGYSGFLRLLFGRLYRQWRAVVFDVRKGASVPTARWDGNECIRLYTPQTERLPSDIANFIQQYEYDLPATLLSGGWVFVVDVDGQCLHFGSVSFNSRQTRVLGEPRETPLIGQCFTIGSARGKGLYRRALSAVTARLLASGFDRVLIETHPRNRASIRGIEAAGFTRLRDMTVHLFLNRVAIGWVTADGEARLRGWLI